MGSWQRGLSISAILTGSIRPWESWLASYLNFPCRPSSWLLPWSIGITASGVDSIKPFTIGSIPSTWPCWRSFTTYSILSLGETELVRWDLVKAGIQPERLPATSPFYLTQNQPHKNRKKTPNVLPRGPSPVFKNWVFLLKVFGKTIERSWFFDGRKG